MDEGPDSAEAAVEAARQLRDREAPTYDERSVRRRWELTALDACLRSALDLGPEHVALDAGCGTGRLLPWLARDAHHVIGVDYSVRSLELARARLTPEQLGRTELHAADVREIPVADAVADRALSVEVVGDLPDSAQRLDATRELARVLRPGGVAVLTGYHWPIAVRRRSGRWGTGLQYHGWTPRELRRLLRAAGFREVRVGGAPMLPVVGRRLGVPPRVDVRTAFTPLGRHLGFWALARATR
jgi:ubiquinone/menaquinone biosynthesis C-methylase UbiE